MMSMKKVVLCKLGFLLMGLMVISCTGRIIVRDVNLPFTDQPTWKSQPSGTSAEQGSSLKPSLELVWKKRFLAGVSGSILTAGRTVLLSLLNGEFVALRLEDGKQAGTKRLGRGPVAGLTLFNDKVYFTLPLDRKQFRSYDIAKGKYDWKIPLKSRACPIAADSLRLYVTGQHHRLYCLNRADGSILWEKREEGPISTGPVLHGDKVFYCDRKGTVFCRESSSGRLVWKTILTDTSSGLVPVPYSEPVVAEEHLFITTLAGTICALRISDGNILWQRSFSDPIYASPATRPGAVVIPLSSGQVVSLDAQTGENHWMYDSGMLMNSTAVFTGPLLSVVSTKGDILILSAESGDELWRGEVEGRIITPPVIASEYLLIADDKKWVYAYIINFSPVPS